MGTNNLPSTNVTKMGNMGSYDIKVTPPVPSVTQSVTSKPRTRIVSSPTQFLRSKTTLRRGSLLGIARPIWLKVLESECRQVWLDEMVRKDLVVRDIENYAKSVGAMLRSEELRFQEKEREILKGLMNLKARDEKINF